MYPFKEQALSVIKQMHKNVDDYTKQNNLNFSLLTSAAEGVTGAFARHDQAIFKDKFNEYNKGYYTNSFHVPVFVETSYIEKIDFEVPYHALCNGGCNYISINFPLDNCNKCGFIGKIGGKCTKCGSDDLDI